MSEAEYSYGLSEVESRRGRRIPRRSNHPCRRRGHPSTRKDEGEMTSDIVVEGPSYRAHIKVIGRSDYFDLWIGDGRVDVSVPLTPGSARALAELLFAISTPERRLTPSTAERRAGGMRIGK